jgi:hypothetical protein
MTPNGMIGFDVPFDRKVKKKRGITGLDGTVYTFWKLWKIMGILGFTVKLRVLRVFPRL